jgi:hypothetical protein
MDFRYYKLFHRILYDDDLSWFKAYYKKIKKELNGVIA